nr:hypothetical protein [uncultured Pseudodesulfovibrio sp.]
MNSSAESSGNTTNEILISVRESSDARVYDDKANLIQKTALEELRLSVDETLERIPEFKASLHSGHSQSSQFLKTRFHDVIAVLGERGTGKTTFVLNALKEISKEKNMRNIGIIDPTLIDVKESIFFNIISRIRSAVDEWWKQHSVESGSSAKYTTFRESLNELARGLAQINGIGSKAFSHDAWDSPNFIMEEGLTNVIQGEFLERDFHLFVKSALECLEQEAFVMAFDDIDTNFSRGWDVLEILRKYLTSPQLVVFLSGDFDLYSCLVRMNQWAHFDSQYLERDAGDDKKMKLFHDRIDSLEDQYLLKIMKPSRRIELQRIDQVMRRHVVKVIFAHHSSGQSESLEDVLKEMLKKRYHLNTKTGLEMAIKHLVRQPVRTIIQVLQCIESCASDRLKEDSLTFHFKMAQVFNTPLSHFGFHWSKDVLAVRDRFGMSSLAQRLKDNNLLNEEASLPLGLGGNERNSVALVMGGLYAAAMWQNPALIGDYFIKVLQVRDFNMSHADKMGMLLPHVFEIDEPSLFSSERITAAALLGAEHHVEPLGHYRISSESIRKTSVLPRISAVWNLEVAEEEFSDKSFIANVDSENVSAYVRSFVENAKNTDMDVADSFGLFVNTLDTLSDNIRSWHKSIMNALFVRVAPNEKETFTYLSAYQLVGLLALLGGESKESIEYMLHSYLSPQDRFSVSTGAGEEDRSYGDTASTEIFMEDVFEDSSFAQFLNLIELWQENKPAEDQSGLQFNTYGRIWKRFQRALNAERKTPHVGYILELYSVVLLDSILVEEALHKYRIVGDHRLKLSPLSTSDTLASFGKRLASLYSQGVDIPSVLPLYNWYLSCPIWPILLPNISNVTLRSYGAMAGDPRMVAKDSGIADYPQVKYDNFTVFGLTSLLNTLCFPMKNALKEKTVMKRTALQKEIDSFLQEITKDDSSEDYYNFSSDILKRNWSKIMERLNSYDFSSFFSLSRAARNDIYFEFVTDEDYSKRSYVKPSSYEGKAYLKAFMELYRKEYK